MQADQAGFSFWGKAHGLSLVEGGSPRQQLCCSAPLSRLAATAASPDLGSSPGWSGQLCPSPLASCCSRILARLSWAPRSWGADWVVTPSCWALSWLWPALRLAWTLPGSARGDADPLAHQLSSMGISCHTGWMWGQALSSWPLSAPGTAQGCCLLLPISPSSSPGRANPALVTGYCGGMLVGAKLPEADKKQLCGYARKNLQWVYNSVLGFQPFSSSSSGSEEGLRWHRHLCPQTQSLARGPKPYNIWFRIPFLFQFGWLLFFLVIRRIYLLFFSGGDEMQPVNQWMTVPLHPLLTFLAILGTWLFGELALLQVMLLGWNSCTQSADQ